MSKTEIKKIVMLEQSNGETLLEKGDIKGFFPVTRFTRKYGTKWRWAVFIHILSLINQSEINDIDKERLSFLVEIPESFLGKQVEDFFSELFNLISKQCMVNIRVTPINMDVNEPLLYEIGIT